MRSGAGIRLNITTVEIALIGCGVQLEGERINEATPQDHWKVLTTLGAPSLRGIEAVMTIASPTDGEVCTTGSRTLPGAYYSNRLYSGRGTVTALRW